MRALRVILDRLDVTAWLSDGAALGAYRDGQVIGGDIDLGCWIEDMPAVREALGALVRVDRGHQLKGSVEGVKFDVHGHVRSGSKVYYALRGERKRLYYAFSAHLFDEFHRMELDGISVLLPTPPEAYLEEHYGPDWRTPNPHWRPFRDPPCLTLEVE